MQITVIQANNDIGLQSQVNAEIETLEEQGCEILDIQFQHTALVMGEGTRPSFAAMIIYNSTKEDE